MEALGPKSTSGLAKVLSPGTATRAATLFTVQLAVDLDLEGPFFLSLGGSIVPLFLTLVACLPFFVGEISGVSSRGHFSPVVMLFAAGVAPLDSPPFAI